MCAGGLIVLYFFLLSQDIYSCITEFDSLAHTMFKWPKQPFARFSQLRNVLTKFNQLWNVLIWWLSDGMYNVSLLESALKESFGANQRIFDSISSCRVRVGVTATIISDATPFIFSNYNGMGKRVRSCGKLFRNYRCKLCLQIHRIQAYTASKFEQGTIYVGNVRSLIPSNIKN